MTLLTPIVPETVMASGCAAAALRQPE